MDNKKVKISVYSSIATSKRPEIFQIEVTATARSLMVAYLQKHRMQLIDPNLITIWRLSSDGDESGFGINITDGKSERLAVDDLIITPDQLLIEDLFKYYVYFERGVQIKVVVNIDKSKSASQLLLISTLATGNLIIKLLHEHMPFTKQGRLNLRHKTGILKGNENLVSLIINSKSDEFFVDLNRSLQYDKKDKQDILRRIKTEYERRKSDSLEERSDKINSNLSKTVYHGSQLNHRKLPNLAGVRNEAQTSGFDEEYYHQEIHRRSLPLIPSSTPSAISQEAFSNHFVAQPQNEESQKGVSKKESPPEPILRTNLLFSDQSSSSTTSIISLSEDSSVKEELTFRNLAPTDNTTKDTVETRPNLFQIVKYFDLHSIDLSVVTTVDQTPVIEFSERLFRDVIVNLEKKPRGPNPILGSENSAFKLIESAIEASKMVLLMVSRHRIPNIDLTTCNICPGDVLVEVDGENVIARSKDYINMKLKISRKHSLVVARLKSGSSNNKEKDEKINKLKGELEVLKKKYSDLHHVTVDNDKLIQQLTKVLKNQETSNLCTIKEGGDFAILYN